MLIEPSVQASIHGPLLSGKDNLSLLLLLLLLLLLYSFIHFFFFFWGGGGGGGGICSFSRLFFESEAVLDESFSEYGRFDHYQNETVRLGTKTCHFSHMGLKNISASHHWWLQVDVCRKKRTYRHWHSGFLKLVDTDIAGPSYSQDQDQDQGQDPGPDFGHHWRRIKMLNVAKNIKISIEYQNWHNIVYIHQFLTRNLNIYHFFWLLEFDYFLALQHDNWAPRTSPGPTQDHGFGPLKHKILTFGLYSIYVMNIEINCDNHAKFQVEIGMLTIF